MNFQQKKIFYVHEIDKNMLRYHDLWFNFLNFILFKINFFLLNLGIKKCKINLSAQINPKTMISCQNLQHKWYQIRQEPVIVREDVPMSRIMCDYVWVCLYYVSQFVWMCLCVQKYECDVLKRVTLLHRRNANLDSPRVSVFKNLNTRQA